MVLRCPPHPEPESPNKLKTYAEMVFSRGSGGRPTVSCFWCDSRSVQACMVREGEGEKDQQSWWGRVAANKFSFINLTYAAIYLKIHIQTPG